MYAHSMTSIWLIIFSIIPPLVILALIKWARYRCFVLPAYILGATLVHEILLVSFPTIYSVLTNYKAESRMLVKVTADDLLSVMIGESIFIFMFAIGLVITLPNLTYKKRSLVLMSGRTQYYIISVLIILGFLVYIPTLLSLIFGAEASVLTQLANALTGHFWYMPLVPCAFLITKRGEFSANPVRTFLALIPLLSLIILGLTTGIRGRIAWVISLIVLAGLYNRRKTVIIICLIGAIALLPAFSLFGTSEVRAAMIGGASPREVLTLLYNEITNTVINDNKMTDVFLDAFAERAQGVRNSVMLYKDSEGGGGGFATYKGALVAFVPRALWAEKPMLGSLGHSAGGMAMYKVMDWGYGTADADGGTMGPMLASAHAYWEGGVIWLVVGGLITGLFWNIIFSFCRHLPAIIAAIIIFTFAAAHLIDGLLTMLVPLYSIIIRSWLSLLPLFLIYLIIRLIRSATARSRVNGEFINLSSIV